MAAICEQCTTQDQEIAFYTVKQLFEHKKSNHTVFEGLVKRESVPAKPEKKELQKEQPKEELRPVEEKGEEKKPIVLAYRYEGNCELCNKELDTIAVDLEEKQMMIAYCPACRKQWAQQEVVPIGQQKKKK